MRPGDRDCVADSAGFVLAGGRSARMGIDKAMIPLAGQPLIVHALNILRQAGLSVAIAGARTRLASFAPVVADCELNRGPLGGICAALASTTARWAVFLPVDMPLVPASLVTLLLQQAEACGAAVALVEVNGFTQTFPAVVEQALLPGLRIALQDGKGGCLAAFRVVASALGQSVMALPLEIAVQDGRVVHPEGLPVECWFLNVNTAEDLARAEVCLPRGIA